MIPVEYAGVDNNIPAGLAARLPELISELNKVSK